VPEPQLERNELADKPAAAAHLIHGCVAKIERPIATHFRFLRSLLLIPSC
jgi:hypothetical protein